MAVLMMALVAPLQIVVGHESGVVAHHYQPAKVAAMEGWWETRAQQPTLLFGWPDEEAETNHAAIGIPGMGSWFVAGDAERRTAGPQGISRKKTARPSGSPSGPSASWSRMGLVMVALGVWGAVVWALKRLDRASFYHRALVLAAPSGFIAVLAGWISAEVGRQPYVVYGVLRTADAVSPVAAGTVATSLLFFMIVYAIVFSAGALYILRLMAKGPETDETAAGGHQRTARLAARTGVASAAEKGG